MYKTLTIPLALIISALTFAGIVYKPWTGNTSQQVEYFESGPVVMELFTSQGCSSCPPADRFLRELADDPAWKDKVIPLSYHVDYWNYLGWSDPFSKEEWTERQGNYVQALGGATMYTPQIVVQGRDEAVGSRYQQVKRALKKQVKNPLAHLVKISIESLVRGEGKLQVDVSISGKVPAAQPPYVVLGVVFEKGLSTNILRGENAGQRLENDFVVRNLNLLTQLQETTNLDFKKHFEIQLDERDDTSQWGIAVLVQNSSTMEIIGAAAQY